MGEMESLKIFEVDIKPCNLSFPVMIQRFSVAARNHTEAHQAAINCICCGIPSSVATDWIVENINLVKDYKL